MMKKVFYILATIIATAFYSEAQYYQLGGKLIGTDEVGFTNQGVISVMSENGNVVAVGGHYDNSQVGAVWVFTFNGVYYEQLGNKLVGTGNSGASNQGLSLSMSADGKLIAVGGYLDNGGTGAVWIYSYNGSNFIQFGNKIVGSGLVGQAYFGSTVKFSADGSTLLIAGPKNNFYEGAIWIYTFNGSNFVPFGNKLLTNDAIYGAYGPVLGRSLDISRDKKTLVAGGYWDNSKVGATWVYTFNGSNYVQYGSKLVGSDAIQGSEGSQQGFASKISEDGKIIVTSGPFDNESSGAVWAFSFTGTNYAQIGAKMLPVNLSSLSRFGIALAISSDGNELAIGANIENNNTGSLQLYSFDGSNYITNGVKIMGSGVYQGTFYGSSISFSKNTDRLLTSGYGSTTLPGGAWIFKRDNANNCTSSVITIASPIVTVTSVLTITSPPVSISSSIITVTSSAVTVTSIVTVTVTVYKIIMVDENGNTITGMNNRNEGSNINIYPNPTNGTFSISSENIIIGNIEILNSKGTKVYETKQKAIDLTSIPKGIYLLKIIDLENKLIETRKLLIE